VGPAIRQILPRIQRRLPKFADEAIANPRLRRLI